MIYNSNAKIFLITTNTLKQELHKEETGNLKFSRRKISPDLGLAYKGKEITKP